MYLSINVQWVGFHHTIVYFHPNFQSDSKDYCNDFVHFNYNQSNVVHQKPTKTLHRLLSAQRKKSYVTVSSVLLALNDWISRVTTLQSTATPCGILQWSKSERSQRSCPSRLKHLPYNWSTCEWIIPGSWFKQHLRLISHDFEGSHCRALAIVTFLRRISDSDPHLGH